MAKVTHIPIPKSSRKRALFFVDIQSGFLDGWKAKNVFIANLQTLCKQEKYDLYVEITFHAEKNSFWFKQTDWTFPYEQSIPEVIEILKDKNPVRVVKETRSGFKGDKDLCKMLRKKGIQEVHITGFDSNDCVFATAQESFDLGFYTYVIEECTGASGGLKMHKNAIEILQNLGLTNH